MFCTPEPHHPCPCKFTTFPGRRSGGPQFPDEIPVGGLHPAEQRLAERTGFMLKGWTAGCWHMKSGYRPTSSACRGSCFAGVGEGGGAMLVVLPDFPRGHWVFFITTVEGWSRRLESLVMGSLYPLAFRTEAFTRTWCGHPFTSRNSQALLSAGA